jgi:hypothetical protein
VNLRRVLAGALAALVVGVIAALLLLHGGEDTSRRASTQDPLRLALRHVPADAPFVAVVETSTAEGPGRRVRALAERFPGSALAVEQLEQRLFGPAGLSVEDLRPLLGGPVVLAFPDAAAVRAYRPVALVAGDPARLHALAARAARGRGDMTFAVRGPLLVAGPKDSVRRALTVPATPMTPAQLSARLGDIDARGAVVRVVAAPAALRLSPAIRRIPWVVALRDVSVAVVPQRDAMVVRARARTASVAPDEVPLALGAQPPAPRGGAPLTAAVRDLAHTLAWLERHGDALSPRRFGEYRELSGLLARFAGLDLSSEVGRALTGTTTITSVDGRTFTARGDLSDPRMVDDALGGLGQARRLADLANLFGIDAGGIAVEDARGGGYAITRAGGGALSIDVRKGALVASTDPRADLGRAAAAPRPGRLLPAKGALHALATPGVVTDVLIGALGLPDIARAFLHPLGPTTLDAHAERDGVTAELRVRVAR